MSIPSQQMDGATRQTTICPYCGSTKTELFSLFGQQLLTVQYYCLTCHTPFEAIKDDTVLGEHGVAHLAPASGSEQAQQRKEETR
jgi:DNA-directed RNA polymerase subunit RPC12/RpoP